MSKCQDHWQRSRQKKPLFPLSEQRLELCDSGGGETASQICLYGRCFLRSSSISRFVANNSLVAKILIKIRFAETREFSVG